MNVEFLLSGLKQGTATMPRTTFRRTSKYAPVLRIISRLEVDNPASYLEFPPLPRAEWYMLVTQLRKLTAASERKIATSTRVTENGQVIGYLCVVS